MLRFCRVKRVGKLKISTNERETMTANKFLREKIRRSGVNIESIADKLNATQGMLNNWINRGAFPKKYFGPFGKEIGLSISEMENAGVKSSRSYKKIESLNPTNLLPIIKLIIDSKAESVTLSQIEQLLKIKSQLTGELTPVLVGELLKSI
jgi:hypothetical protein